MNIFVLGVLMIKVVLQEKRYVYDHGKQKKNEKQDAQNLYMVKNLNAFLKLFPII